MSSVSPVGSVSSSRFVSLSVYTSETCNLACRYCFLKKNPVDADWKTLRRVLDWWFAITGPRTHVHIFGTEPLYRWDLLKNFFQYAELLAARTGRELTKGITTNGVTLNANRAKWLTAHNVACLCSIDGTEEQHNRWRVFPSGKGSYAIVSKNFKRWVKLNLRAEAAFTVTPDAIPQLAKNVNALFKLGFRAVALNKCIDSGPTYSSRDFHLMRKSLGQLCDLLVDYARKHKVKHVMFITNNLIKKYTGRFVKNVTTSCGACKGSLATDVHGRVFICHRAIFDYPLFGLGDVWNGVDWARVEKWRSLRNAHCQVCSQKECSPCYVVNYICNGDIMKTPWEFCMFNQLVDQASVELEMKLRKAGLYDWYCRSIVGKSQKPVPVPK